MAGLREKITYRSAFFFSDGGRARDALQAKATRRVTSKVVRETASRTRSSLTLGMSTLASTRLFLYSESTPPLCGQGLSFLYDGDGKRSRYNSR